MKNLFVLAAVLVAPWSMPAAAAENPAAAWDTCAGCHADLVKDFAATPHAASPAGCVGCHGPADAHVEGGGDPAKIRRFSELKPAERNEACTTCHNGGKTAHWVGGDHDARGLDCTTCHSPHPKGAPRKALLRKDQVDLCGTCHAEQRSKLFRGGHMPVREGRMECTSCHNPHGTLSEHQLLQNSINDNCYGCHAEKRGPFLWEHEAVREDCVNCHDAHGSIHKSMLKVKMPVLCQSCHTFSNHPSTTWPANTRIAFNKSCVNCHSMIHGSNHPSGNYFTR